MEQQDDDFSDASEVWEDDAAERGSKTKSRTPQRRGGPAPRAAEEVDRKEDHAAEYGAREGGQPALPVEALTEADLGIYEDEEASDGTEQSPQELTKLEDEMSDEVF